MLEAAQKGGFANPFINLMSHSELEDEWDFFNFRDYFFVKEPKKAPELNIATLEILIANAENAFLVGKGGHLELAASQSQHGARQYMLALSAIDAFVSRLFLRRQTAFGEELSTIEVMLQLALKCLYKIARSYHIFKRRLLMVCHGLVKAGASQRGAHTLFMSNYLAPKPRNDVIYA